MTTMNTLPPGICIVNEFLKRIFQSRILYQDVPVKRVQQVLLLPFYMRTSRPRVIVDLSEVTLLLSSKTKPQTS